MRLCALVVSMMMLLGGCATTPERTSETEHPPARDAELVQRDATNANTTAVGGVTVDRGNALSFGVKDMPLPTAENLAGDYAEVSKTAPEPGGLRVQLGCDFYPGRFVLEQRDGKVILNRQFESYASGVPQPPPPIESAEGPLRDPLVLDGAYRLSWPRAENEAVRYELHFDPATSHLVGTRNGKPLQLVPVQIVLPQQYCPPRP